MIALGPNLPLNLPTSHSLRNHEFNIRTLDARSSCVCTSSPLSHKSDIDRGRDACSFLPAITLAQSLNHTRMRVGAHADDYSCTNGSQPCCECTHTQSALTHTLACTSALLGRLYTHPHPITHPHSHARLRSQTTARARTGRSRTVNRRRAASGSTRDAQSGVRAQATAQTHASRTGGECVTVRQSRLGPTLHGHTSIESPAILQSKLSHSLHVRSKTDNSACSQM